MACWRRGKGQKLQPPQAVRILRVLNLDQKVEKACCGEGSSGYCALWVCSDTSRSSREHEPRDVHCGCCTFSALLPLSASLVIPTYRAGSRFDGTVVVPVVVISRGFLLAPSAQYGEWRRRGTENFYNSIISAPVELLSGS